jgi:hypothetical protein
MVAIPEVDHVKHKAYKKNDRGLITLSRGNI